MTTATEQLALQMVPLAAELVGTVRDFGPDDVAAVLARVPDGRLDALAVVLAAMVDPDQTPANLLAWVDNGPVPSRDFSPGEALGMCPECDRVMVARHVGRHLRRWHPQAVDGVAS